MSRLVFVLLEAVELDDECNHPLSMLRRNYFELANVIRYVAVLCCLHSQVGRLRAIWLALGPHGGFVCHERHDINIVRLGRVVRQSAQVAFVHNLSGSFLIMAGAHKVIYFGRLLGHVERSAGRSMLETLLHREVSC